MLSPVARRRLLPRIAAAAATTLIAFNLVAFVQAWRMTHFVTAGARTPPPESLSTAGKLRVLLTGVRIPRPSIVASPDSVGLSFETRSLPTGNGGSLETWTMGRAGAPVVALFHGYAASKSSLLPVAAALDQLGFASVLVDFRGSGGSTGSDTTIGPRESRDVAVVLDHLRASRPRTPVALFGQSLGAAAILRACAEGAHPDAIVVESPFNSLVETVGNRFRAMGLPAFPFAHALVFWGGAQHGAWGLGNRPARDARSVRCPSLLFSGGRDRRVTPAQADEIARALPPPSEYIFLESAGHLAFVTAAPEIWRERVGRFLATHLRAPTPPGAPAPSTGR